MAARVLPRRPEPTESVIRVGEPVSSGTWQSLGALANYLRGTGAELVPAYCPAYTISSGATAVFNFRVKPRGAAIQRIWCVLLKGASGAAYAEIKAPASTGTLLTAYAPPSTDVRTQIVYVENLAAKSSAEGAITLEIKANGGNVTVDSIACYEQTRPILTLDSTDYGCDLETLRPRDPIYYRANRSWRGVADGLAQCDPRTVGLFQWAVPEAGAYTRTTASYLNIFTHAVPIIARKLGTTAVTGSVKWAAYAKVAGGAGGQIRVTTTESGVSDSVTVSGTSFAWTTARAIAIDCTDMDSADGRQTAASPAWDRINFALQGDGTNALSVAALSVWDDST